MSVAVLSVQLNTFKASYYFSYHAHDLRVYRLYQSLAVVF